MIQIPGSVVALLSAVVGYIGAMVTEYLRDSRARAREREARDASRRERLQVRRSDFQRETLLNLQEAVMHLARACGRMHHHDEDVHGASARRQDP